LASQERMEAVVKKKEAVTEIKTILSEMAIEPSEINSHFSAINSAVISEKQKVEKILLRPNISLQDLMLHIPKLQTALCYYEPEVLEQVEIQIKYQVYINKEQEMVLKMRQLEDLEIPEQFDFQRIISLGAEAREKLNKIRPRTLGQASRISGINPTDVQILMVYMGR